METIGPRIAYYLVEKGLIQKEDLESVLAANQPIGVLPIEEQLINAGLLSPEQFRSVAEEFFGAPFASQDDFPKEPLLFDHLSIQFMKESKFIPSRLTDNTLTIIMSNPLDFYTIDAIRLATQLRGSCACGAGERNLRGHRAVLRGGGDVDGEDH